MPSKLGTRTINMFFKSKSPSPSPLNSPSRSTIPPPSPTHRSFSDSIMEENIEIAQSLIQKWDSNDVAYLFSGDRQEARQYLNAVKDLQSSMHYFISQSTGSENLVRAQILMQAAMKRLQKEFYQILSSNRQYLDPESVSNHSSRASTISSLSDFEDELEDELRATTESISEVERVSMAAMADLKSIADCMISSGYGKECVKIYNIIRKSIVDEGLYHLGVEKMTNSQIQKTEWDVLELKIKSWLNAVKVAVKTLFYGERILCDHVFSASASIRESCFSEIVGEGANALFGFPEMVAKTKKSPEKMFRTLDLYEAISDLWPEIDSIFSYESTSAVRSHAVNSLVRLGEAVRTILADFESAITKDTSKAPVQGGGVHPLTRYVMNYIAFLADYGELLADIVADWPLAVNSPLPESYFGSPDSDHDGSLSSSISVRMAWLVLVLLCKLDGKAELYRDVSLSYLFLANNLQYVVVKVRNSNLRLLLGEDWVAKHEEKVKQYASNYERVGWSKVFAALPEDPTAEISTDMAKNYFRRITAAFEEAYRKQTAWVVPDPNLRDEVKVSVARKLVTPYRAYYEKHRVGLVRECGSDALVRYAPENIDNYLSDLFFGAGSVGGSVSSSSSSSHSRGGRRGR
ncbi:Exocyst complex protein [Trema orientale]|uniref:Exocyst subunit Exo70 family protein n=1 Tax=Trema orientale TaxID=63057 RepID=A0A2P5EVJ1_TREOI|nr:Exocyst complex protein [Trema orientale]